MDTSFIKGIIPPIAVPLKDDETFDEKKLRRHVDFVIDGGVSAILAFGSNGEFYMQEEDEMKDILDVMIDQVAGRVPVFMGIGAIRTSKCIRLARMGIEHGAKAVSVLQPMFLKPSEDELFTHFSSIAGSVPDVPVLLYNNPGRTGYTIPQTVVEKLAHEVPNVVGMKDSNGNVPQLATELRVADPSFQVMTGTFGAWYPALTMGITGIISAMANCCPEPIAEVQALYDAGRLQEAFDLYQRWFPVNAAVTGKYGIGGLKYCADRCGYTGGFVRNPLLDSTEQEKKELDAILAAAQN